MDLTPTTFLVRTGLSVPVSEHHPPGSAPTPPWCSAGPSTQPALAETGLRFGPKPATHVNCALGGMIGNNSCGAIAQRTGKVVDNIARLEVLLAGGTRFWRGETTGAEYTESERHGEEEGR